MINGHFFFMPESFYRTESMKHYFGLTDKEIREAVEFKEGIIQEPGRDHPGLVIKDYADSK